MLKKQINVRSREQGFIQAALLFGIALITAVLGGFALANRSPTSQTDAEQAKVNASVILKQASDLRDGVARYAGDFGSSAVLNTLDLSAVANTGLFDPQFRYASPQIMPRATFRDPNSTYATIKSPSAAAAGHWYINKATAGNILATTAADPMVILPGIRQDVCGRVNTLLYGSSAIPTSTAAVAAWIAGTDGGISSNGDVEGWPEGCVATNDATPEYVYFKAVQEN